MKERLIIYFLSILLYSDIRMVLGVCPLPPQKLPISTNKIQVDESQDGSIAIAPNPPYGAHCIHLSVWWMVGYKYIDCICLASIWFKDYNQLIKNMKNEWLDLNASSI